MPAPITTILRAPGADPLMSATDISDAVHGVGRAFTALSAANVPLGRRRGGAGYLLRGTEQSSHPGQRGPRAGRLRAPLPHLRAAWSAWRSSLTPNAPSSRATITPCLLIANSHGSVCR